LEFVPKSNRQEYLLEPGEYEIVFEVSAANVRLPQTFTFYMNLTGDWDPDEQKVVPKVLKDLRIIQGESLG
jgi:hypothetical protein